MPTLCARRLYVICDCDPRPRTDDDSPTAMSTQASRRFSRLSAVPSSSPSVLTATEPFHITSCRAIPLSQFSAFCVMFPLPWGLFWASVWNLWSRSGPDRATKSPYYRRLRPRRLFGILVALGKWGNGAGSCGDHCILSADYTNPRGYLSADTFGSFRASTMISLIRAYNPVSSLSHLPPFGNTTFRGLLTQGINGW